VNRLAWRLTLSFIAVTLTAVATVAALASWQTSGQFRQYLARQAALEQSGQLAELASYFGRVGSWDGVAALLESSGRMGSGPGGPRVLLADSGGTIRYDARTVRVGEALSQSERELAVPIVLNDQVVGYLVMGQFGRGAAMPPAEEEFLARLRQSLLLAALVASGLGIVAALWLSHTLTAPLARLAVSAGAFARREWQTRAPAGGPQEVAEVARAFNAMAGALEQAERQRRSLMADIAHELRTPLSVLQGNLRALLDGVYPLELREIASLYDETRLLSRLVEDLRELALADAGQLRLQLERVPAGTLLTTAVAQFTAAAEAKGIQLEVALEPDVPPVLADPGRLAQVVRNLLANALRHTPAGGRISCRLSATTQAAGHSPSVSLSVADTGEGIAPADLPRVFERFYRSDASRARYSGGAGLGLAIAKSLIEAMGGAIEVESRPDAGSRFTLRLKPAPA
jgi:two-component system OmpR family sensor kinase/two-component system sensor histidine kinase BaeS